MLGPWCALWAVLAGQAPAGAPPVERPRVFVLDFQSSEDVAPHVAQTLTALVTTELTSVAGLHVLSGAELRELLALEGERQAVGCADDGCLAEIAGALGARYAVSGRISTLGEVLVLQLRMMDVHRAVALARVVRNARSLEVFVEQVPDAVRELVAPALAELGVGGDADSLASDTLPPSEREPAAVKPRRAEEATALAVDPRDGGSSLLFWGLLGGGGALLATAALASAAVTGLDVYLVTVRADLGPEDAIAPVVYGASVALAAGALALVVGAFLADDDEPDDDARAEGAGHAR